MSRKKPSRNAPCPCGSGRKYKNCCYGKGVEDDLGLGSARQQPQYPLGTVAMYGPDDRTTTKIAAGVILHEGAEPIIERWVATGVMTSPKVRQELKETRTKRARTSRTARIAPSARSGRGSRGATSKSNASHPRGLSHARPARSTAW
jgi:hypothetical protein